MRLGIGLIFSVAAFFQLISSSNALDRSFCDDYAARAERAVKKAKAMGCTNSDAARWNVDRSSHRAWCIQSSDKARADRETQLREDRANQCGACRTFAKLSSQAIERNRQLGCGRAPSVIDRTTWEPDAEKRFAACQNFPNDEDGSAESKSRAYLVAETNQMFGDLARCKAEKQRPATPAATSSKNFCRQYADRAVAAVQKAKAAGCIFNDARWTSTHVEHERWCLFQLDREVVNAETDHREARAAQCSLCREYAKTAVEAARQNIAHNCGKTGPSWSTDEQGHFSWCERSRASQFPDPSQIDDNASAIVDPETNWREGDLARCIFDKPKTGRTQQSVSVAPGGGSTPVSPRDVLRSSDKIVKPPNRITGTTALPQATLGKKGGSGGSDFINNAAGRNNAMDRLAPGGGSTSVGPSAGAGGRPTSRPSAPGGLSASSPASSSTSTKDFGRRGQGSIDYGFAPPKPSPRPVK